MVSEPTTSTNGGRRERGSSSGGAFKLLRLIWRRGKYQRGSESLGGGPDKLPDNLTIEQKDDKLEMALGTIILNLSDNVLREVNNETTASNVWKKLESLYLTNKKLSDENEVIILINSLPESFRDVKATIKYGRFFLTLEEYVSAPKSKDLELKIEKKDGG
ncbi:hypothetical protein EZV62_008062 [Acer yangbiense]|uniref:Uncharacterized protein n=1 Tax=Acer yangbiense TaxID=1000413 RepID=A0A5C7IC47_9ROSI|nr:hypothetical protein EZV62_008062 [Acer yangbiense]